MVWCGILAPKTLQSCCAASGGKEAVSQHQIRHIVGQIKELSVGCGDLQPDIAI